jgi:fatty acid synthase
LEIDILKSTGRFGVSEGGSLVASGYVSQPETHELSLFGSTKDLDSEKDCTNLELEKKDVYKELCVRGYEYGRSFQCIESSDLNGELQKYKIMFYYNEQRNIIPH